MNFTTTLLLFLISDGIIFIHHYLPWLLPTNCFPNAQKDEKYFELSWLFSVHFKNAQKFFVIIEKKLHVCIFQIGSLFLHNSSNSFQIIFVNLRIIAFPIDVCKTIIEQESILYWDEKKSMENQSFDKNEV